MTCPPAPDWWQEEGRAFLEGGAAGTAGDLCVFRLKLVHHCKEMNTQMFSFSGQKWWSGGPPLCPAPHRAQLYLATLLGFLLHMPFIFFLMKLPSEVAQKVYGILVESPAAQPGAEAGLLLSESFRGLVTVHLLGPAPFCVLGSTINKIPSFWKFTFSGRKRKIH